MTVAMTRWIDRHEKALLWSCLVAGLLAFVLAWSSVAGCVLPEDLEKAAQIERTRQSETQAVTERLAAGTITVEQFKETIAALNRDWARGMDDLKDDIADRTKDFITQGEAATQIVGGNLIGGVLLSFMRNKSRKKALASVAH